MKTASILFLAVLLLLMIAGRISWTYSRKTGDLTIKVKTDLPRSLN